jgi:hypothetical protein
MLSEQSWIDKMYLEGMEAEECMLDCFPEIAFSLSFLLTMS